MRTSIRPMRLELDAALPQETLDIEQKARSNLFPWRGQFSPQFAASILESYAPSRSVVIDPFMGCGTVLIEAAQLGHEVHGWEVNPAAYTMARVYELCSASRETRLRLLENVEDHLHSVFPDNAPLFQTNDDVDNGNSNCRPFVTVHDMQVRSLLDAVITLADTRNGLLDSAVTWPKWKRLKQLILDLPLTRQALSANLGDARSLSLSTHSVDFVLTSPPYINVFNYHHNFRAAIEALGWRPLVVAKSEIGSNRKFRQNRFLTVVQYAIDIALAIQELQRVCRPRASIIMVLGRQSNVLKTQFYNAEIVANTVKAIRGGELVLRQERTFLNRFGKRIVEDLLHIRCSPDIEPNATAISLAKEVGIACLKVSLARVPKENRHLLEQAIAIGDKVEASPLLDSLRTRLPY